MEGMTKDQAYAAMYYYLKGLYEQTGADYLSVLVTDLSLTRSGVPTDPAVVGDWNKAVELALKYGKAEQMVLRKP